MLSSVELDIIDRCLLSTLKGDLIPEADLQLLSTIDFGKVKYLYEKFIAKTITGADVDEISAIIAHNIAYPHANSHRVEEILNVERSKLKDLYLKLDDVAEAMGYVRDRE